jgi:hypothetical protein
MGLWQLKQLADQQHCEVARRARRRPSGRRMAGPLVGSRVEGRGGPSADCR